MVFYSLSDITNIQTGSLLRYADGGLPLEVNYAIDTSLLQFVASAGPTYSITRSTARGDLVGQATRPARHWIIFPTAQSKPRQRRRTAGVF